MGDRGRQDHGDGGRGRALRPGEFQHGYNYNGGDETVVALGLGAPAGSEDVEVECPACGARTAPRMERTDAEDAITVECRACEELLVRLT